MTPVGPPAEPGSLEWSRVSGDGLGLVFDHPNGSYRAAVIGDTFVLLGNRGDPTGDGSEQAVAWRSNDGRHWTAASLPGADDWNSVSGLAVGGPGLVAVGTDQTADPVRAVAWLSADGSAWERIDDRDFDGGFIAHAAATPEGFIAFGSDVWVSEDGREWSRSSSASAAAVSEGLGPRAPIIAHDGKLTAFASSGGRIEVWRSATLEQWEMIAQLPRSAGPIAGAAVRGPLGWVLTSATEEGESRLSTSVDGESWDTSPGFGPATDLLAHAAGYVAVGYEQTGTGCATSEDQIRGFTWTSPDGRAWTEAPRRGWAHQRIDQLLRVGRQLIGVGITYRDGAWGEGAVWTARLPGGSSNNPTEPAPTDETAQPGCGGPGD